MTTSKSIFVRAILSVKRGKIETTSKTLVSFTNTVCAVIIAHKEKRFSSSNN